MEELQEDIKECQIEDEVPKSKAFQYLKNEVCKICNQKARYRCPTCKIFYCSVECYKKHSSQCTEDFYERNTIEELKATKSTPEQRKQMIKILERVNHSDLNNAEHEDFSKKKMQRLQNLKEKIEEDKLDLNSLAPDEQKEFLSFVKTLENSNFNNQIRQWIPWWKPFSNNLELTTLEIIDSEKMKKLNSEEILQLKSIDLNEYVQFDEYLKLEEKEPTKTKTQDNNDEYESCSDDESETEQIFSNSKTSLRVIAGLEIAEMRKISIQLKYSELPVFESLFKGQISPYLKYHLINIIYPFLFYSFFYNGEVLSDKEYILYCLMNSSDALVGSKSSLNIISLEMAIEMPLSNLIKLEQYETVKGYIDLLFSELEEVVLGKIHLIECIFRLYDFVHSCDEIFAPDSDLQKISSISQNDLKKIGDSIGKFKNKLIFMGSYVKCHYNLFANTLKDEINSLKEQQITHKKTLRFIERIYEESH